MTGWCLFLSSSISPMTTTILMLRDLSSEHWTPSTIVSVTSSLTQIRWVDQQFDQSAHDQSAQTTNKKNRCDDLEKKTKKNSLLLLPSLLGLFPPPPPASLLSISFSYSRKISHIYSGYYYIPWSPWWHPYILTCHFKESINSVSSCLFLEYCQHLLTDIALSLWSYCELLYPRSSTVPSN